MKCNLVTMFEGGFQLIILLVCYIRYVTFGLLLVVLCLYVRF